MANYIMLINFTDQGIHKIQQSPERAEAAVKTAEGLGVRISGVFWCLGQFDGAVIAEAPDEETMTAFALKVASLGYIRTEVLRAYRAEEFRAILGKMK